MIFTFSEQTTSANPEPAHRGQTDRNPNGSWSVRGIAD